MLVDRLQWQRPLYLRIVTVLLVLLISASAIFALGLRTLHELVLGIGGIILGIWGVRSVVVQTELPDVTLIDLILAFVMLVLLLALSIRAARYFYVQSTGTGVMGYRVMGDGLSTRPGRLTVLPSPYAVCTIISGHETQESPIMTLSHHPPSATRSPDLPITLPPSVIGRALRCTASAPSGARPLSANGATLADLGR